MFLVMATGCGDDCQQLCLQTSNRISNCKSDALTWADLGARSRNDFVQSCRTDWEIVSGDLTQSDHQIALDVCADARRELNRLGCDEVMALYGPLE